MKPKPDAQYLFRELQRLFEAEQQGRAPKKRRRRHVVTLDKILTAEQIITLFDYLRGRRRAAVPTPTGRKPFARAGSVDGRRALMVCQLLLASGMRIGELAALRLKDTPTVTGYNAIIIYRGKGDQDRTVPIDENVAADLDRYIRTVRGKTMPRHHRRSDARRVVFYSQKKKPVTTRGLAWIIRSKAAKAGLARTVTPHMFRHTYASMALAAGHDIKTVQALLGHTDIKTTSLYLHIIKQADSGLGKTLNFTDTGVLGQRSFTEIYKKT